MDFKVGDIVIPKPITDPCWNGHPKGSWVWTYFSRFDVGIRDEFKISHLHEDSAVFNGCFSLPYKCIEVKS
jgi:hypothetical protein